MPMVLIVAILLRMRIEINRMEFEEWAKVTTSMVSIFIKQSHIISLVTEEYYQAKKRNMDNRSEKVNKNI